MKYFEEFLIIGVTPDTLEGLTEDECFVNSSNISVFPNVNQ